MPLPPDWSERALRALPGGRFGESPTDETLAAELERSLRDGGAPPRERLSLWIEFVTAEPAGPEALADAARALTWGAQSLAPQQQASDIVVGWDPDLRRLFDWLAVHAPAQLEAQRDAFPERARVQIDFALALVGRGAWPEHALLGLARHYLNCPPGTFVYEGRVPEDVIRRLTERLLREENVPLLQWSRLLPLLDGDEGLRALLLVNYCARDFRARAFDLAEGTGVGFAAELLSLLHVRELSFSGAIAVALVTTARLAAEWGEAVPAKVRQALLWDLRSGSDEDVAISLDAYRHLAAPVASALLRECLREERALALLPAVDDDQVIHELLARIQQRGEFSEVAIDALVACGERARRALLQLAGGGPLAPALGLVAAEVFGRLPEPDSAALVALLGHGSKRVVASAARFLERAGEGARQALEGAARSGKKAQRVQAERLLGRLGEQGAGELTPLSRVRARVSQLAEGEGSAFLEQWRAAGDSEAVWQATLRPAVRRLGASALELLREWFAERVLEGETRLWCYAVEELREDADAVWVAVDSFARMPKLAASLWARPRRALGRAGALLGPPIVYCLRNVHTEYREALYGLLAANASDVDASVFLQGLSDASKLVRTHSVDGLSRALDPPLHAVAALLQAPDLGARIAAAELLAVWGDPAVADAIAQAWDEARSVKLQPYLEDTLVACGRQDLVFGGAGSELGEATALEFLARQRLPKKLPGFVHLEELPSLRTRAGLEVDTAVREGLLARLLMLDLTLKGRSLRRLLQHFDAEDLAQFGRWIYTGWARARNAKHKWAMLQLSLLADAALLDEAMAGLGAWRSSEHTAIACHLRAAQWHGSATSVAWLGYWSENLPSLGARATARQLFGRVAFKRGCSLAELRRELDPFLLEERSPDARRAPTTDSGASPKRAMRQRPLAELERAWISGRGWSAEGLLGLFTRERQLELEGLLFRSEDGCSCRAVFVSDALELWGFDDARLPAVARVRLAHPLELTAEERAHWRGFMASNTASAVLDRDVYHAGQHAELAGIEVPTERFAKWRREQRWFHGEPMDAGIVYSDSLHLLGRNLIATLQHSGYDIGSYGDAVVDVGSTLRVLGLSFSDLDGAELAPEQVLKVVYSEIHRSVRRLALEETR